MATNKHKDVNWIRGAHAPLITKPAKKTTKKPAHKTTPKITDKDTHYRDTLDYMAFVIVFLFGTLSGFVVTSIFFCE